jgi:DNA polymerase-4
MPARRIAHLDLDCFFVSVERVLDRSLEGKPVVVGGDPAGRGVVSSCSYEARSFGVRSAMPMARALALCPRAVRVSTHGDFYRRASRAVFRLLRSAAPLVEAASVDEAYLDLSGTERLAGPAAQQMERLRREIREILRLPSSVGIASGRVVAKVASEAAKPDGLLEVPPGEEAAFLAPRPVGALPGIGPRARQRLEGQGLHTLGDLASLEDEEARRLFGSRGERVRDRARGIDPRPLVAEHGPPKSVSHERTFARDVSDLATLEASVDRLAQRVGRRLRRAGLLARTVSLKYRDASYRTFSRSRTLSEGTHLDSTLSRVVRDLLSEVAPPRLPARLVGVAAQHLTDEPVQEDLFDRERRDRLERLARGVDRVRDRFGFDVLGTGLSTRLAERRRRD